MQYSFSKKFRHYYPHGTVYDENGGAPCQADIAITADTIAFVDDLKDASAKNDIDAKGKAIAPGFINMLSWAR